jgi:hypothetical protein
MASYPATIRRARFSWHFYTPGRRRWVTVQIVSASRDFSMEQEQAVRGEAVPHAEPSAYSSLLDNFSGEMWQRRSL